MTADDRRRRTDAADASCAAAFVRAAGRQAGGVALVAVGGYGRRELAPHSDLDVVLVHRHHVDVRDIATDLWYPLWDAEARLDHAVRALPEVTAAAEADVRVALGLLDARHLAGDPAVTRELRAQVLGHWRRTARQRLPQVRDLVTSRNAAVGELAQLAVPDLKESAGGLRDATVLTSLVATWMVDVPHADLQRQRRALLDARDALHEVTGRPGDRVAPELWPELAAALGLPGPQEAQRHVRRIGRRVTHLSRLTWKRVEGVASEPVGATAARSGAGTARRPGLVPLVGAVAVAAGEVVLDFRARPGHDPTLLLRCAAEAAERDLALAPATAARLARDGTLLPRPWPAEARQLFVRLLGAGPGLLPVWETLEETGALDRILPEWDRIRLLPHVSPLHRYTVDRHLVETCIEASRLVRRVARPDLLLVAALLHDIGKGLLGEHSAAGAPVAGGVAGRMGLGEADAETVRRLVREHLLLGETATTRDLEDPATVALVAARVGDVATLELLHALTEADARATAAKAWSGWRAGLVADLVRRVRAALATSGSAPTGNAGGLEPILPEGLGPAGDGIAVSVAAVEDGSRVTVRTPDRVGLLAAVAAAFSVHRIGIRAVRAWTLDTCAVSVWEVAESPLDEALLRQRIEAILDGRLDVARRLPAPAADRLPASVAVRREASAEATVLEVRAGDQPGVLHRVCAALAAMDVSVRSAHAATLGSQAVDVFYLQEPGAGALSEERSAAAAHAVRRALGRPATLEALTREGRPSA